MQILPIKKKFSFFPLRSEASIFHFSLICLLGYLFIGLFAPKAQAASLDLGVFPPIIQIDTLSPASITTPISIENFGDETVVLSVVFAPFTQSDKENGEVEFLSSDEQKAGPDPLIFNYMQIRDNNHNVDTITLAPGQQKTVELHIGLPKDELPGDYYFSVLFISKDKAIDTSTTSGIAGGIATNVLLSVGPKDDPVGEIVEFSSPFFLEKGPVPFTVRVRNTGNHVFAPQGKILIANMFGQTVGNVDLLPVHILAKTTRAIPDILASPEATGSAIYEILHTKYQIPTAFWHEDFLLGPYTATVNIALSDKGPVYTRKIYFVGFPLYFLLGLIIAVMVTLYIRERVKKKLRSRPQK